MPHNEFVFIAHKKFVAGHPPGSGIEVTYEIGDVVPAGEWGRAAETLVESGKIVRQVITVADPDDVVGGAVPGSPAPSTEKTALEVNAETDVLSQPDARQGSEWPKPAEKKGFYELSDGSVIYGKNKAVTAQNELEAPAPAEPADEGEEETETDDDAEA